MTTLPTPPTVGGHRFRPHRGTTILVLGILSLVIGCFGWVLGIIALKMANSDLREMNAGVMDPSGRGLTDAGRICGIIGIVLHLFSLLAFLLWMVFVVGVIGMSAAAGAHH